MSGTLEALLFILFRNGFWRFEARDWFGLIRGCGQGRLWKLSELCGCLLGQCKDTQSVWAVQASAGGTRGLNTLDLVRAQSSSCWLSPQSPSAPDYTATEPCFGAPWSSPKPLNFLPHSPLGKTGTCRSYLWQSGSRCRRKPNSGVLSA